MKDYFKNNVIFLNQYKKTYIFKRQYNSMKLKKSTLPYHIRKVFEEALTQQEIEKNQGLQKTIQNNEKKIPLQDKDFLDILGQSDKLNYNSENRRHNMDLGIKYEL